MDSHLVSIEVGVECGTYHRMKSYGFSFDEDRLECLDTESVKCRSTVQHDRVLFDHVLENVPYSRVVLLLDHFFSVLYVLGYTCVNQLSHNERLEQLDSHLLRETALIHLQIRSHDDNGTS